MIVLDTHIWVWWVDGSGRLTKKHREYIEEYQSQGLGVSIVYCWEVALTGRKKSACFFLPVNEWLEAALAYPGVQLLNLTLPIVVDSTQLSGFHNDPFDQIIVATARINGCPMFAC